MSEYKQTLNLPQTDFPMKANLANREPNTLQAWQDMDLYAALRKQGKGREKFILHDGPPYANGAIHLGHALNKILKDIIVKAKTLSGFDAPFVPGWDCHGLPIELNIEKKFGRVGTKLDPTAFRKKCRDYAASQIDIQRDAFIRLGIQGDWYKPYITMDFKYEANIVRALGKIIENKHVKAGFKPVYWCVDCRSSLAEAEVEYKNKQSPSIDVRFKVLAPDEFIAALDHASEGAGEGPISVPIWTTTPWTLPANQAVALSPDTEYDLVQIETDIGKERLLLARPLLESAMQRYGIERFQVVASGRGQALADVQLQHPFYDRQVPTVLGDHVTMDAGTGCVHTAPGHGLDDYIIGKQYDLEIENPVADNGCFKESTEIFAGEHVFKANEHIIEVLKENSNLVFFETIEHSYPHCWRHKTPVIFRATPQWFIAMNDLREATLKAIKKVSWIPDWGEARISGMMENRPDWCISRQRTWSTPMSLFLHKETKEMHPNTLELMEQVAKRIEQKGFDAWHELDPSELLGDESKDYEKSRDTLDVWFDAGVTHACVVTQHPDLQFPADLYFEGSDQHRGWFNSSLLSSIAINNEPPYRQVLTHGYTVDADGYKMSKSRGNVISPDTIINKYGADVLRLWVSSTDYVSEISMSDEIIKRTSDTYRRIRNTARFLLSNLFDFDPKKHLLKTEDMLVLDRYAVHQAKVLQEQLCVAYDTYQFHTVYQKIHHFCAMEMGSFYLDIIKDRQYTMQTDSIARRSCQTAMYHILEALVRWLAPVLSFTSEEIWQVMPGERDKSVFLSQWYDQLTEMSADDPLGVEYWQTMQTIRDAVNKELEIKRAADVVGSGLAADVNLYCDDNLLEKLTSLNDELRFVLITSTANVYPMKDKPADAVVTDIAGLALTVTASASEKCSRCWHRRSDVGDNEQHPELCARCINNITAEGETRYYA